ncbi:unnamed protein product [Urochloa decumbens]|uniref:NB-ARC domain-containing protein n=1 Tax=Urochloa decumbens TaxID=240449 RepID=A0ABC8VYB8_9POAL
MNAALVDASRVPPDQLSELDKLRAWQVRELSYDMEDAVDDFLLRVVVRESSAAAAATDAKLVFKKIFRKVADAVKKAKDRHQICDKVRDIKKLSNELAELRARYTVRGVGANNLAGSTGINTRVINMYKKESDLVGIEDTRDQVIRMLTGTSSDHAHAADQSLKIASIVGVGRLGKTALAKTVHGMLKKQFHCCAFISVDRTPNLASTFEKMLVELDQKYWNRADMARWDLEQFCKELQKFLQHNSQEGESIIDGLSSQLVNKIMAKCGGVPLAITAIASLLVDRPCDEWSKVYDSIGFGNGDNTMKILSYSYYDLPSYLKPCLLHLSIFPEDYILDTNSVIWMWIGEGFVHLEKEEGSLFEVGERYFKELVNRSMIQQIEDKFDQFTQWFRVHDIVFDLICELSRHEKFATILDSREQQASSSSSRRENKANMPRLDSNEVRLRIWLHFIASEFAVCYIYMLRSYVPINLKHLGRLLHLKYLEISDTPIDELPNEIGHLKSLQALLLFRTGLHDLPQVVCSLTQLMCLIAVGIKRLPADRMGNLTSLEELWLKRVVGRSATEYLVEELGKLTRLRVVSVTFSNELEESLQKAFVQSLCNLRELQDLVLASKMSRLGATIWEGWEPPRKLRRLLIQGIIFSRQPG